MVYCEYSTGSGIDRKNQWMREVERVTGWILILFWWLIAISDRAARILETGWSVVAGMADADWATARWSWRRLEHGSLARGLPHFRSIGWMTYCLGKGWIGAPPGLVPVLVSRAPARCFQRLFFGGEPNFVLNDHFLFCFECVRGFNTPSLGALGHSAYFSMPASAAGL